MISSPTATVLAGVVATASTTLSEPGYEKTMFDGTGDTYPNLDRFGRLTSDIWEKTAISTAHSIDHHDVDISYDRNSNIAAVLDNVQTPLKTGRSWSYTNDGQNRLTGSERGTTSTCNAGTNSFGTDCVLGTPAT